MEVAGLPGPDNQRTIQREVVGVEVRKCLKVLFFSHIKNPIWEKALEGVGVGGKDCDFSQTGV